VSDADKLRALEEELAVLKQLLEITRDRNASAHKERVIAQAEVKRLREQTYRLTDCACEWRDGKVFGFCGAHAEAARHFAVLNEDRRQKGRET